MPAQTAWTTLCELGASTSAAGASTAWAVSYSDFGGKTGGLGKAVAGAAQLGAGGAGARRGTRAAAFGSARRGGTGVGVSTIVGEMSTVTRRTVPTGGGLATVPAEASAGEWMRIDAARAESV